jgi:hypothetical protein
MINQILPEAIKRFRSKSSDYGEVFKELGLAGQYSDMHRKMHKLRKVMWEGRSLKGEQADEILSDLFGNILISLYLLVHENDGETKAYSWAAGTQPLSGQDRGSQGAAAGGAQGGAREQAADEVRKPASP